jgi:hypothetical protein
MKRLFVVLFAAVLAMPVVLVGDARAANGPNVLIHDTSGQTTGSVTVRRRRHGPVRRTVNRGYRGGKYVAHKTVRGTMYVTHKSVQGTKYVVHKTHRTGRKVVSRTKKLVQ